jgi:hypothetical protein
MGLLDVLQSASNAVAGNVAGPVDILSLLLRKGGIPVPDEPVGGSEWMKRKGLMRDVPIGAGRIAGETLGLLAPTAIAAKAPQIARGLLQAQENAAAPRTLSPEAGVIVYHGSPHKFDKFDASKIGTGEGAQAYGHGIYLADAPATAKTYQNMAPAKVVFDGGEFTGAMGTAGRNDAATKAWNEVVAAHGGQHQNPFAIAKEWLGGKYGPRNKVDEEAIEIIKGWQRKNARVEDGGAFYKADLPDEWLPKMLDWDKPLNKQSESVIKALEPRLAKLRAEMIGEAAGSRTPSARMLESYTQQADDIVLRLTGQELYSRAAPEVRFAVKDQSGKYAPVQADSVDSAAAFVGGDKRLVRQLVDNSPDKVSRQLQQLGIPGIRYLDGGSRGAGQGTYNYVVFPGLEDQIKILERNGVPLGLLGR